MQIEEMAPVLVERRLISRQGTTQLTGTIFELVSVLAVFGALLALVGSVASLLVRLTVALSKVTTPDGFPADLKLVSIRDRDFQRIGHE